MGFEIRLICHEVVLLLKYGWYFLGFAMWYGDDAIQLPAVVGAW